MRKLRRAKRRRETRKAKKERKSIKSTVLTASTAAALAVALHSGQKEVLASEPDQHQLPVSCDADGDLIKDANELAIGYEPFRADQNRNGISDGVELAKRCASDINDLPIYDPCSGGPEPNEIYKMCAETWGVHLCPVCGEAILMVFTRVVNPKLGLVYPDDWPDSDNLSSLSLHFMEHGSFSSFEEFAPHLREEIPRLMRVLDLRFPNEPNEHQLPLDFPDPCNPGELLAPDANDYDNDLLADSEELDAGSNLYNPDQDEDLTPDGIELAKQCAAAIDELPIYESGPEPNEPYKELMFQYGQEWCEICGQTVNMGFYRIVNPNLGLSMDVYDISHHYMSHGSFSWWGDYNPAGRIDVGLLVKVLEMPRSCGDLGTKYLPGDLNKDCKEDFTDFADFAEKWLESTDPNDG